MLSLVRNGKKAPATCPECHCRLNTFELHGTVWAHHYAGEPERDAKGHLCSQLGSIWTIEKQRIVGAEDE